MNAIVKALSLLTPFDIDIPKIRIGPKQDGGYILADKIGPHQNVVSYGISTEYGFDAELAARGHRLYMFDHTIDSIAATSDRMTWFKEGVAAVSKPHRSLFSIEDHLKRHDIVGDDLLMQMDVEGAEYDALAAAPDAVLARFEQIVVEVHFLARLTQARLRERVSGMLSKLNRQFTLFHVHDNNFSGGNTPSVVAGLPCCDVIELSYIRTDLVERNPSETLYPTCLDWPNNPAVQDKMLWFFPFAPSRVLPESYVQCADALRAKRTIAQLDNGPADEPFDTGDCIDVAVGKAASQSSTSVFSTPDDAMGAVSGEVAGISYGFHTEAEDRPWWQVDLGADYPLECVVIHNRADGCGERAYDLVLMLATDATELEQVYARKGRPFGNDIDPARILLRGQTARYVRVGLESRNFLHLDAVEVYVRRGAAALVQEKVLSSSSAI